MLISSKTPLEKQRLSNYNTVRKQIANVFIIHEFVGNVQRWEVLLVREFQIRLHSLSDVQAFVSLSTVQPFAVFISNSFQKINAKSFIGMFAVDYSKPVTVTMECEEQEYLRFRQAAARFLAT